MALDRKQVAAVLDQISTLLELKGENPFKARAYAVAARTLEALGEDLAVLIREERLGDLKGIGEALAEKIATLATTGSLPYYEDLKREIPAGLLEMIQIPGLGPKRAKALHDRLGIESVEELEYACRQDRLSEATGFGARSQKRILEGIAFLRRQVGYGLLSEATALGEELLTRLSKVTAVRRCQVAGSLRRRKEVVRDIDLLASHKKAASTQTIIKAFTSLAGVAEVLAAGETKASVRMASGRQVDLRVVSDEEYPFALHYFTGSAEHNIALRRRAQALGYKINEYGLWKGQRRIPCKDESEIFRTLGLAFIPPELREDWGEIEAAEAGRMPQLVEASDIRGVFHVHSSYSDGTDSLEVMVKRCAEIGYSFVGISDHSRSAGYAGGLSLERVEQQRSEIQGLRRRYRGISILHGTESDILRDGSLDYPRDVLERFDFVVGSVHGQFTLNEEEQTRRVVKALQDPCLTILGHPTGRLLLQREGFPLDMDQVLEAAGRAGKFVELNANPHRLDLDWRACRRAKEAGVKVSVNPDAHSAEGLDDTRYGVDAARRGWLEADDLVNTRPWGRIREMMSRGRSA